MNAVCRGAQHYDVFFVECWQRSLSAGGKPYVVGGHIINKLYVCGEHHQVRAFSMASSDVFLFMVMFVVGVEYSTSEQCISNVNGIICRGAAVNAISSLGDNNIGSAGNRGTSSRLLYHRISTREREITAARAATWRGQTWRNAIFAHSCRQQRERK